MTGFRCDMTGAVSTDPLPPAQVPRRCVLLANSSRKGVALISFIHSCGPDPDGSPYDPNNCTWGAKQPLYWYQAEGNNMFEDTYHPPLYTDKYNFKDGAQNDIFNSTPNPTIQPSGSTSSPVPYGTPAASTSYSSSPAPLPSPSPSPSSSSYPPDTQPSLPPPSSPVPSPSSYPSYPQPSLPPPSSPLPCPSSYPSNPQPSLPPPPPSPVPASPTDQNDPEYTSKSKKKCKHGSKRSKQSSVYRRVESDQLSREK
jgi:hypothetical protein